MLIMTRTAKDAGLRERVLLPDRLLDRPLVDDRTFSWKLLGALVRFAPLSRSNGYWRNRLCAVVILTSSRRRLLIRA